MKHPFEALGPEYVADLGLVKVNRPDIINPAVARLLKLQAAGHYALVSRETGIPEVWIAASFERESSSDFSRSPAQGDRWDRPSINVPAHRGPFKSWHDAAIDAYRLNGLDKVGAAKWTWAWMCYYGELFNGFGYRDYHNMRTPYLWGGTNLEQPGKYTHDGEFDHFHEDDQPGIVPLMMGLVAARPALAVPGFPLPTVPSPPVVPAPGPAPVGLTGGILIQQRLNALGFGPLLEDGNYGKITAAAVRAFQAARHLTVDGLAGPETMKALAQGAS